MFSDMIAQHIEELPRVILYMVIAAVRDLFDIPGILIADDHVHQLLRVLRRDLVVCVAHINDRCTVELMHDHADQEPVRRLTDGTRR